MEPPSSPIIASPSASPQRVLPVPRTPHDVSWWVVLKAIAAAFGAFLAIRFAPLLLPVLMILVESVLLTCALTPPVHWLMRRGVNRGLASIVVLGGIAGVLLVSAVLITPAIIHEGKSTAAALPGYVSQAQGVLSRFPSVNKQLQQGAKSGSGNPSAILPFFLKSGGGVLTGVTNLIAVIFISAYLLARGERSLSYLEHYFSPSFRQKARRATPGIIKVVSGYVFGQAATSALFGVFTFVTLELLGVPQPLLLAVLAAIFDAIPLVGTLIATVIAVLLALTISPTTAIIVLALFLAYNVLESNVILPNVYGRAMGISSLAVLIAVLVGYALLGLVGVLIALPLTAAIKPAESAWRQGDLLIDPAKLASDRSG